MTSRLGLRSLGVGLLMGAIMWVTPVQATPYHTVTVNDHQQKLMMSRFYLQFAENMAARGYWDSAADSLEQVYLINPDQILAGLLYANFLDLTGESQKAINVYQTLYNRFDQPREKSAVAFQMAFAYEKRNEIPQAIDALQTAIHLFPGQPPADYYYNLGVMYARNNDYNQTVVYSKKALELQPQSAVAWNNYGYGLTVLGNVQEGYVAIHKALELDPDNPAAIDSMGFVLMKMGKYNESIAEFEKAIKLDPSLADSFLHLGESFQGLEQWDKAAQYYQRFVEMADDPGQKQNAEKMLEFAKTKALSHSDQEQ